MHWSCRARDALTPAIIGDVPAWTIGGLLDDRTRRRLAPLTILTITGRLNR